ALADRLVHDLADALFRVQQATVLVELRGRLLLERLGVEHDGALGRAAERTLRLVRLALHAGTALRRAVVVGDRNAEPLAEAEDVALRGFVAEHATQRVVAIIRRLGRREDVRERLTDVVEVR